MSGLLSAQTFDSELCGDESLSTRPMGRVIKPLREMGADISGNDSKPPLSIKGGKQLSAIEYTLPVASAQIKSCLLLAGLYSEGLQQLLRMEFQEIIQRECLEALV